MCFRVLLALFVVACSATPRPSSIPETPSTTFVVAPSAPAPTATATPTAAATLFVDIRPEGCVDRDAHIGEPALCPYFDHADLDGDGRDDEIALYLPGHETHRALPLTWTVTLRTATKFVKGNASMGWLPPMAVFGIRGTADANGDGRPDAFLAVGNGASTTWMAVLTFDGTAIHEVVLDPMLLTGGSVRHLDAIECRDANGRHELIHRQISDYTELDQWDVVERVYVWNGSAVVLNSIVRSDFRFPAGTEWPTDLARRYGGIVCGTLKVPS